jgi:VWFA-related protein
MHRSLVGAFALTAAATLVSSQEPSTAPEGPETPPVFEAGTELVRLDLVVRDEDGDLIRDLRADEIQVFEDGQPVTVTSLRLVDAEGRGPLQATSDPFTERPRSIEPAIKAATWGADVRYDQVVDLAADTKAQPHGVGSTGDRAAVAMAAVLSDMRYFENLMMREERGRNALYPLLTLARSLRGVQGRKTLLHSSQGIEVTPDIDYLLSSAISEANRSNLAIYTFDARGLFEADPYAGTKAALESAIPAEAFMGPAQLWAMQQGTGGGGGGVSKLEIRRPEAGLDLLRLNVQENLRELAEGTSGFLVANNNDLHPGLDRVTRDLRSFYEIAYVPPHPEADGRFRRVAVEVARDDVKVRVRKGYFALPPGVPVIHPWEERPCQSGSGRSGCSRLCARSGEPVPWP